MPLFHTICLEVSLPLLSWTISLVFLVSSPGICLLSLFPFLPLCYPLVLQYQWFYTLSLSSPQSLCKVFLLLLYYCWECWWHSGLCRFSPGTTGGTVVVHMSLTTVIRVWFRQRAVIWLKVTLVKCEKRVVQFDSTKRRRFSPSTPVSSSHKTGPMRVGPYWTSRETNSDSW